MLRKTGKKFGCAVVMSALIFGLPSTIFAAEQRKAETITAFVLTEAEPLKMYELKDDEVTIKIDNKDVMFKIVTNEKGEMELFNEVTGEKVIVKSAIEAGKTDVDSISFKTK